jgi:pyruvate formate lyase activating enzyme
LESGLIFDIQGYSVHDGPGCRTLVFLSGCPLRCAWCANPEGQLLHPRVLYHRQKCVHTKYTCVTDCPHAAITIQPNDSAHPLSFDHALCEHCDTLSCVNGCLNGALTRSGRSLRVDELLRILTRDQGYWGEQGGVTFTGGEPLVQSEFLIAALKACRSQYIHTAVETCAHVKTETLLEVMQWTDWLFIDLKHMDTHFHQAQTGSGNELILENIRAAAAIGWQGRLILRMPFIPGYNDSPQHLHEMAAFIKEIGLNEINLLSFHRMGASKYEQLGLEYPYAACAAPSQEALLAAQRFFEAAGLECYGDAETPF